MTDNSHGMVVTRAIIHTGLYGILWRLIELYYGRVLVTNSILKFLFYGNLLLMVGAWYESYLIAKGHDYDERDIVKLLLFTVLFMVLLEFWNIFIGL